MGVVNDGDNFDAAYISLPDIAGGDSAYERLNSVPPTHMIVGTGEPIRFHPPQTGEVQFVVTVRGFEPPSDWPDKIQKRLTRECKFAFGQNFTVERLDPK